MTTVVLETELGMTLLWDDYVDEHGLSQVYAVDRTDDRDQV